MIRRPYRYAPRVFWVMDNGSSHRGARCLARLQHRWPNLIPVHTPVHASCLNQVEIYLSVVQRKALTPNDFRSQSELEQRLLAFQKHHDFRSALSMAIHPTRFAPNDAQARHRPLGTCDGCGGLVPSFRAFACSHSETSPCPTVTSRTARGSPSRQARRACAEGGYRGDHGTLRVLRGSHRRACASLRWSFQALHESNEHLNVLLCRVRHLRLEHARGEIVPSNRRRGWRPVGQYSGLERRLERRPGSAWAAQECASSLRPAKTTLRRWGGDSGGAGLDISRAKRTYAQIQGRRRLLQTCWITPYRGQGMTARTKRATRTSAMTAGEARLVVPSSSSPDFSGDISPDSFEKTAFRISLLR